jgi:hypothetical protein
MAMITSTSVRESQKTSQWMIKRTLTRRMTKKLSMVLIFREIKRRTTVSRMMMMMLMLMKQTPTRRAKRRTLRKRRARKKTKMLEKMKAYLIKRVL